MARDGYKIIDSDMHIMEPPDLWQRYTDKKVPRLCTGRRYVAERA